MARRFFVIRHTSLRGQFRPGVRVTGKAPLSDSGPRMRLVAETASSFVVPVVASAGVHVVNAFL